MKCNFFLSKNKRWVIRQAENTNWIVEDLEDGYKEVVSGSYPEFRQPWMIPRTIINQAIKMMSEVSS